MGDRGVEQYDLGKNKTDKVGSRTPISFVYDSVSYDLGKTRLSAGVGSRKRS